MGQRGEVFSTKLVKNDRTYFFNVKENMFGDLYLNIVESKPMDNGRHLRQSVLIYQEDIGEFVREFQKSLDYIKMNASQTSSRQDKEVIEEEFNSRQLREILEEE